MEKKKLLNIFNIFFLIINNFIYFKFSNKKKIVSTQNETVKIINLIQM